MSLRRRLTLYLLAVHLLFAATAVPFLSGHRLWLVVAEGLFALSLGLGVHLVRRVFAPLDTIRQGTQFIDDGDFTARMRAPAQPELAGLVRVYNRMVDHLREERTRVAEQHHFLAQLQAESPSGIVTLTFDGAVDYLNPAARRLLGAGAEGQPLAALAPPLGPTLAGLGPGEARVLPLPGGRRVRGRRGAFMDRGFPRAFFLLEELTEELRQAEKAAYEKLIRMMSHEVNNSVGASNSLLHSCLNYVPLLPEEHRGDLQAALEVVIGRTEQLSGLMRGFAEVVRLPPPQLRPCDVDELLRTLGVLMGPACARQGVTWQQAGGEPVGLVALDRAQLEQVLVNVAKNALEAIGAGGGSITVRTGRRGGRPFLVIEDSGPGLSAEAQAQLFTPFFTTKAQGQGIGLTLVQQILDQHRFGYALEGPPGGPTQFTIVF